MRNFLLGLSIAGLIGLVGINAATLTGGSEGGSPLDTSSTMAPNIAWTMVDGQVTGARVTWMPGSKPSYVIKLKVGDSLATKTVMASGVVRRTDTVTLSTPVDAELVSTARLLITDG